MVVSGLPYMTPIFWRIWLMKMMHVRVLLRLGLSTRRAWLISRACIPMLASPMSLFNSFFGTRAATLSMTIRSTALLFTSISAMRRPSSP